MPKKPTRPTNPDIEPEIPDDEAIESIESIEAPVLDPKGNRALRKAAKGAPRTPEQSRLALRKLVRIFYDLQRLRIQTGGRTLDRATEIELHETDLAILEARKNELLRAEKNALLDIKNHLSTMPAYNMILADKVKYKGIGPTLAGVILSEVDITRAKTASALWRYAGLAPVAGRRCHTCHDSVVPTDDDETFENATSYEHEFNRKEKCGAGPDLEPDQTYASHRTERAVKGTKLPFNRFFKTKMVGVAAGCLLKANSPWRLYYDNYKHRLESEKRGRNEGHRHRMAMRYMVKMLLAEIWGQWRRLEGLEVRPTYQEQYLGHIHHTA